MILLNFYKFKEFYVHCILVRYQMLISNCNINIDNLNMNIFRKESVASLSPNDEILLKKNNESLY